MSDFELFGDMLKNLVYMILYPFIKFIEMILTFFTNVANSFLDFYDSILNLIQLVIGFITSFLSGLFFTPWISLIMIGIGIVFILRVYFFIRGSK